MTRVDYLGMQCHCGSSLYGLTENETWYCGMCNTEEDLCECEKREEEEE